MSERIFETTAGDKDTLTFALSDDGGLISLIEADKVEVLYEVDGVWYAREATILDQTDETKVGYCTYTLDATDTARLVKGPYKCKSKVTWADGSTQHFPVKGHNIIQVEAAPV